jgi:hypothetical protein
MVIIQDAFSQAGYDIRAGNLLITQFLQKLACAEGK